MPNKMIIDASHPEETRVVVLRGNRVEEFDFESANKKPLRGNIYLAKVTRVEPSLQAAFVDYGGNRHGFLAFSEIHPDYYQIPVADRQALLEEEARAQHDDEEEPKGERRSRRHRRSRPHAAEMRSRGEPHVAERAESSESPESSAAGEEQSAASEGATEAEAFEPQFGRAPETAEEPIDSDGQPPLAASHVPPAEDSDSALHPPHEEFQAVAGDEEGDETSQGDSEAAPETADHAEPSLAAAADDEDDDEHEVTTLEGGAEERAPRARQPRAEDEEEAIEQVGGDAMEEMPHRAPRLRRHYKIQEVIKRRQVLLVQVVKEERGNKGAALTTYLSLAGRYSVLMPNTARGGGISRKITNALDRSRLKSIAQDLEVPEGMGVILRTAGASRTKAEVKRDFEYLLRMWETVRELTLSSSAPTLVYEEGSLIKRAIRDLYDKDVEEVTVAGDAAYHEAKEFMRLLMPSHAKNVHPYRDQQPVFARAGVEAQLDALFSNQVTLKSGGYIVINQTEALVAIDVNSGRSTREHNIEDTALRTNLEAADEIARQLRLRDLAGLIVLDLIDMEEGRNNRAVERRLKDALKNDRARIQVGRISHFGLLEMSRQRIRTGVLEGSTVVCPHCMGGGVVRSTASIALHVLRVLEDNLIKSAAHNMTVRTRTEVALYILNQKRRHLRDLERRFGVTIMVAADESLTGLVYHALERGEPASGVPDDEPAAHESALDEEPIDEALEEEAEGEAEDGAETAEHEPEFTASPSEARSDAADEESEPGRRRRRRRRRRGEHPPVENFSADAPQPTDAGLAVLAEIGGDLAGPDALSEESGATAESRGEGQRREGSGRHRRGRGQRRGGHARRFEGGREADAERAAFNEPASAAAPLDDQSPGARDEAPASEAPGDPFPASHSPSAVAGAVADGPVFHEPDAPGMAERTEDAPPTAEAPDGGQDAAAQGHSEDPTRPKRSGWWRRARATLVGE
jgi:ribonuclease E